MQDVPVFPSVERADSLPLLSYVDDFFTIDRAGQL